MTRYTIPFAFQKLAQAMQKLSKCEWYISLLAIFCSSSLFASTYEGALFGSGSYDSSTPNLSVLKVAEGNSVFNFGDLSIAKGQTLKILVENEGDEVLLRNTGPNTSIIEGSIVSNGSIYLINPQGIYVGPTGSIQGYEVTVSTFLPSLRYFAHRGDKPYLFRGNSENPLIHLGTIQATNADVMLRSYLVLNEGSLEAKKGRIHTSSFIRGHERDLGDHSYLYETGSKGELLLSLE